MKFLIVTKSRQALPIEAAVPLLEGMRVWAKQGLASKKFEQIWSFAGLTGGGGIINVSSLEELDSLMADYPLSQFSDTQIYALTDLDKAMTNALEAIKRMTPKG